MSTTMNSIKRFTVFLILFHLHKVVQQAAPLYGTCDIDKDCKKNSFCYGNNPTTAGKCKCLEGFTLITLNGNVQCIKGVKLGEACQDDIECTLEAGIEAICDKSKKCSCNDKSHAKNGTCYRTSNFGESCITDHNCLLSPGNYGVCVNNRCACRINQMLSKDKSRCLYQKKLGENCDFDEECSSVLNAQCLKTCQCVTEFIPSTDNTLCLAIARQFFDPCQTEKECSVHLKKSICKNGQCICSQTLHIEGKSCVETKIVPALPIPTSVAADATIYINLLFTSIVVTLLPKL
jgi:hypothetical protein